MRLPYLPGRTPTFTFIVHPRNEEDMFRAKCLSLLRTLSSSDADYVRRVCALPPTIIGEVLFGDDPFYGEIISIPCLPAEVPTTRGVEQIVRAAQIAVERGSKVIGLGALTAPATGGGARLVRELPASVTLTNGNAYTAAVLKRNVLEAASAMALDRPARIAVIGCTGSVGTTVSRLLADTGVHLILIGRTLKKLEHLFGDLAPTARFADDLSDVSAADIVLVLTGAPSARLRLTLLRPGTVVIDAAEPANVSPEDVQTWSELVAVVRGGRVRIRDYSCTYDLGLENAAETFACLAETYLFSREGIREHSVGTPTTALAERLARVAARRGVQPSFALRARAFSKRSITPDAAAAMV